MFPKTSYMSYILTVEWKEGKAWFCLKESEKENENKILQLSILGALYTHLTFTTGLWIKYVFLVLQMRKLRSKDVNYLGQVT